MSHYEFVPGDEIIKPCGLKLKRIRATKALPKLGVMPGDLGGYIESEKNLSGWAWVYDNAQVYDNAWMYGFARVYGNAQASGSAQIEKSSDYLQVGPAKSSGRFTTAHTDKKIGVRVNCGCFSGSVLEFSQQIEETHANNREALEQYRLFCQLIAFNFAVDAVLSRNLPCLH